MLELEQCGTKEGQVEFGTLSMFGQKSSTKEHLSLAEITCVSVCSEKSSPQLAVYTPARAAKLQVQQLVLYSCTLILYCAAANLDQVWKRGGATGLARRSRGQCEQCAQHHRHTR